MGVMVRWQEAIREEQCDVCSVNTVSGSGFGIN